MLVVRIALGDPGAQVSHIYVLSCFDSRMTWLYSIYCNKSNGFLKISKHFQRWLRASVPLDQHQLQIFLFSYYLIIHLFIHLFLYSQHICCVLTGTLASEDACQSLLMVLVAPISISSPLVLRHCLFHCPAEHCQHKAVCAKTFWVFEDPSGG